MGLLLACPPLPVISNALAYIIKLRILLVLKLQIHSQLQRKVHLIRVDFCASQHILPTRQHNVFQRDAMFASAYIMLMCARSLM